MAPFYLPVLVSVIVLGSFVLVFVLLFDENEHEHEVMRGE